MTVHFLTLVGHLAPWLFILKFFIFGCAGSLLLHCLSPAMASGGYSLVAVPGLLIAVASLIAERGS